MSHPKTDPRRDALAAAAIIATWAAIIGLVGLGGDFALNDDWAYAWSVRHLLETGEVRVLPWAAPALVTHVAWGAALAKVFGASYLVLRCGTLAFGLASLLLLYAIARRGALAPGPALVMALAAAVSPWFVNLSFTFMTEVPWTAMLLAAMLLALHAERGRLLLVFGAGLLVLCAALSRQYAIITAPAFVALLLTDALRQRRGLPVALGRAALFLLPVVAGFAAYFYWFLHVHGATTGYSDTLAGIRRIRWQPFAHALQGFHYLGLWLLPFSVAAWRAGLVRTVVTRLQAVVSLVLLAGYALGVALSFPLDPQPLYGVKGEFPISMPYMHNLVYNVGSGVPTFTDVYEGRVPFLHDALWFGWVLTALTTASGVLAGGWLVRGLRVTWRHVWSSLRGPGGEAAPGPEALGPDDEVARGRLRLLLFGAAGCYLGWQLVTGMSLFDRYFAVAVPMLLLLAVDGLPARVAASRPAFVVIALFGLFSVGTTREYLALSGARQVVADRLHAAGIPDDQVDAGFEINGGRFFLSHWNATHKLGGSDGWWVERPVYSLQFWLPEKPGCRIVDQEPFWTWPGARSSLLYAVHCPGGFERGPPTPWPHKR
jgi:hypothetical protein